MKKFIMIIMAVALAALPAMAQAQEWQSTSSMAGSGSNYSSQITAVGATEVTSEATTTESYSPGKPAKARKSLIGGPEDGGPSPIGSEWTLLLFAALAAIVIAVREHVNKSKAQQS